MTEDTRFADVREVRAPRGRELTAKSWHTEAPLRMLMNILDREVAENPDELVVYGAAEPPAAGLVRPHRRRSSSALAWSGERQR